MAERIVKGSGLVGGEGQRIPAPIRLADHVAKDTASNVEELIRRAEAAIETLSAEFGELAKSDLMALKSAVTEPEADRTELQRIFDVSHELRGLAGSFDMPLLTRVGSSLCDFVVDKLESSNALCCEVVDLHIAAMVQIIANKMTGDGGQTGQALMAGLKAARQKAEEKLGTPPLRATGD